MLGGSRMLHRKVVIKMVHSDRSKVRYYQPKNQQFLRIMNDQQCHIFPLDLYEFRVKR